MRYSNTVRFVDRYIGSLALFILTLLHALRPRKKGKSIRNILVIELVEMGASIMAYSSLRYIKQQIPDANIFVLCTQNTKEPWVLLDLIPKENVFALDNRSFATLLPSIFKQRRELSKKNIDLVIDYELFTRISAIISFLTKTRVRAGFYGYTMGGLYRGNFLDVKCYFNQNMHIAKNLLALTKSALAQNPQYYNWNAPIPNKEIVVPAYTSEMSAAERVRQKLGRDANKPLILVAPTVGKMLPMRDYPKGHYIHVIQKLLVLYPKHVILLVGTNEHRAVAKDIAGNIGSDRCHDFTGLTANVQELLELFFMAELLITNDSGNPHFASMTGLKTLALYGPETPFMYGPLGKAVCLFDFFHTSPSITTYNHKNPPSADNESLSRIEPDRVVHMAQRILADDVTFGTVNNEIPYLL